MMDSSWPPLAGEAWTGSDLTGSAAAPRCGGGHADRDTYHRWLETRVSRCWKSASRPKVQVVMLSSGPDVDPVRRLRDESMTVHLAHRSSQRAPMTIPPTRQGSGRLTLRSRPPRTTGCPWSDGRGWVRTVVAGLSVVASFPGRVALRAMAERPSRSPLYSDRAYRPAHHPAMGLVTCTPPSSPPPFMSLADPT